MKAAKKVVLVLCVFWLFMTVIAYFQNRVTVKTMVLADTELSRENSIAIEEIRLIDKGRKEMPNGDMPWYVKMAFKFPGRFGMYAMRIIGFYSMPFAKYEDGWELKISGIFLKDKNSGSFNQGKPDVTIYADGESMAPQTFSEQNGGNVGFFTVGRIGVNPNVRTIKVEIKSGGRTFSKEYITVFNTIHYGFFSQYPDYWRENSPDKAVLDQFARTQKYGAPDGTVFVSSAAGEHLRWVKTQQNVGIHAETSFVGKYKNYDQVYLVTLFYDFVVNAPPKYEKKQAFYLIRKNNKWVVVDVLPVQTNNELQITTDIKEYSPLMSSVMGIGMMPEFRSNAQESKVRYHWAATNGGFLVLGQKRVKEVTNSGEKLLWMPEFTNTLDKPVNIIVTLRAEEATTGKILAETSLTIEQDGVYYYVKQ